MLDLLVVENFKWNAPTKTQMPVLLSHLWPYQTASLPSGALSPIYSTKGKEKQMTPPQNKLTDA
jgi:hypothetical protein